MFYTTEVVRSKTMQEQIRKFSNQKSYIRSKLYTPTPNENLGNPQTPKQGQIGFSLTHSLKMKVGYFSKV